MSQSATGVLCHLPQESLGNKMLSLYILLRMAVAAAAMVARNTGEFSSDYSLINQSEYQFQVDNFSFQCLEQTRSLI